MRQSEGLFFLYLEETMDIENDKIYHALVCAAATLVSFLYMRSFFAFAPALASCWLLPMGLGFGKEYGDSKASGNCWDWWDIVADAVGTVAVMAVLLTIHLFK